MERALLAVKPQTKSRKERKRCRPLVMNELVALAEAQNAGADMEALADGIARRCRDCRMCPKLAAEIAFMLVPSESPQPGLR